MKRITSESPRMEYGYVATSVGEAMVASTEAGIAALAFVGSGGRKEVLKDLQAQFRDWRFDESPGAIKRYGTLIQSRLGRKNPPAESLPLDLHGTAFQKKVWKALEGIPKGKTTTYSEIARRIGRPRATRAVASAIGSNPISLIIPCHRVVRKDGGMGGYRWGLDVKRCLLELENPA